MFKKRGARIRALSIDVAILELGLAAFYMYNKYRTGVELTDVLYDGLLWVVVLGVSYAVMSGIAACVQTLEDIRDLQGGIDPDLDAMLDDDLNEFADSRNADPYDDKYFDDDINAPAGKQNNIPEPVYPSRQNMARPYYDNDLERTSREHRTSVASGHARSPFAPPLVTPEPPTAAQYRPEYAVPGTSRAESDAASAAGAIPFVPSFSPDKAREAASADVGANHAPLQTDDSAPVVPVSIPQTQGADEAADQAPEVLSADNNGFPVRKGWRGRVFRMRKPENEIDDDDDED